MFHSLYHFFGVVLLYANDNYIIVNDIKKAWRTYLLFIPLVKALALPNPRE